MAADPTGLAGVASAGAGPQPEHRRAEEDAPFDIWLRRSLRESFGAIAAEPVPDDLPRLIEEDHAGQEEA
jgi:hypothetical protein